MALFVVLRFLFHHALKLRVFKNLSAHAAAKTDACTNKQTSKQTALRREGLPGADTDTDADTQTDTGRHTHTHRHTDTHTHRRTHRRTIEAKPVTSPCFAKLREHCFNVSHKVAWDKRANAGNVLQPVK